MLCLEKKDKNFFFLCKLHYPLATIPELRLSYTLVTRGLNHFCSFKKEDPNHNLNIASPEKNTS